MFYPNLNPALQIYCHIPIWVPTPLFDHPNSKPITLLDQFVPKVLSESPFALTEWLPLPKQNHPMLASVPTELEWHLPLQSLPQQSPLWEWFALHCNFIDNHLICLLPVSRYHKIWPWQCHPNSMWLAQWPHSCVLNVSSILQPPSTQWS